MKLVTIFNVPLKSSLTNNVFKDSVDKVFFLFFYLFLETFVLELWPFKWKILNNFLLSDTFLPLQDLYFKKRKSN